MLHRAWTRLMTAAIATMALLLLACTPSPAPPATTVLPDAPPPVLQSPWGGVNPAIASRGWPSFTALMSVASSRPDDYRMLGMLNVTPNRVYRFDYTAWHDWGVTELGQPTPDTRTVQVRNGHRQHCTGGVCPEPGNLVGWAWPDPLWPAVHVSTVVPQWVNTRVDVHPDGASTFHAHREDAPETMTVTLDSHGIPVHWRWDGYGGLVEVRLFDLQFPAGPAPGASPASAQDATSPAVLPWGGTNPLSVSRDWPPFTALLSVAQPDPATSTFPLGVSRNAVYWLEFTAWDQWTVHAAGPAAPGSGTVRMEQAQRFTCVDGTCQPLGLPVHGTWPDPLFPATFLQAGPHESYALASAEPIGNDGTWRFTATSVRGLPSTLTVTLAPDGIPLDWRLDDPQGNLVLEVRVIELQRG